MRNNRYTVTMKTANGYEVELQIFARTAEGAKAVAMKGRNLSRHGEANIFVSIRSGF